MTTKKRFRNRAGLCTASTRDERRGKGTEHRSNLEVKRERFDVHLRFSFKLITASDRKNIESTQDAIKRQSKMIP